MSDKHVIGLAHGEPVPRIVSKCDGNGEAWYETRVPASRIKNRDARHILATGVAALYGNRWDCELERRTNLQPTRYPARSAALSAVRNYIHAKNAEQTYTLGSEEIRTVEEPI